MQLLDNLDNKSLLWLFQLYHSPFVDRDLFDKLLKRGTNAATFSDLQRYLSKKVVGNSYRFLKDSVKKNILIDVTDTANIKKKQSKCVYYVVNKDKVEDYITATETYKLVVNFKTFHESP